MRMTSYKHKQTKLSLSGFKFVYENDVGIKQHSGLQTSPWQWSRMKEVATGLLGGIQSKRKLIQYPPLESFKQALVSLCIHSLDSWSCIIPSVCCDTIMSFIFFLS